MYRKSSVGAWNTTLSSEFAISQANSYSGRSSLETRLTSQYRMVPRSNDGKLHLSNAQFPQCGFVCDSVQSQNIIVCISSSGQSSLCDGRIINEKFTCLCIFDTSVLTKFRQSRCRIVLITPIWLQHPWFSEMLQLLVSAPIQLPYFQTY